MTRPFLQRSCLRKTLPVLGLMVWIAGCGSAGRAYAQNPHMARPKMTLWQAIGALARQVPFSQAKLENTLGTRLSEASRNEYTIFLKNESPITMTEDGRIAQVDLRLGMKHGAPGFLVLNLDGGCISLDAVRAHYRDLRITDTPRGHSLDEVTSHSASLPWGELSFSFKERNPNCLSSVAFDPKKAGASSGAR